MRGADVFARQFKIPIFATKKTIENSIICCDEELVKTIKNNETLKLAGLQIEAFSKPHKAADPVFYTISDKKRVSVITDLGKCCRNTISQIKDSSLLFLESNHDLEMLEKGPYPYFLKNWVKSDNGHLSNNQASLGILEHATKKLKHIFLSHLSSTNNTPELALNTLNSLIKERKDLFPRVSVSLKDKPTELIRIN
jgi:phosphoribosyl 1,2-cyclic phosphodiesterase